MKTDSRKRRIFLALSFAAIIIFRFIPPPSGLSRRAMQVMGIFLGVLILWMGVSIDWPSMLCLALLAFVPGVTVNEVLSYGIGNATFAFLMFTFMCTYALSQTPFIKRRAVAFLSLGGTQKSPWAFAILYFCRTLFLGSFISPTVLAVVMIAVTEEIFTLLGLKKGDKAATMLMCGMVFCTGISAGMTPIAHVFPLMAMSFYTRATGKTISYVSYMAAGIPAGLLCAMGMLLIFRFVLKPDLSKLDGADISSIRNSLPPADRREKICISVFFVVVALWVAPGIIKPVFPELRRYIDGFGTAMPPLLGAVALAVVTTDGVPLLDFKKATGEGIPWASLIMVAATLALGSVMTREDIGITSRIGRAISPLAEKLGTIAFVAVIALWRALQTNLSSNMVTVTVVCAVALPICISLPGVNTGAVACLIGIMASYAFATPPAMATVAFAIGSGWADTKDFALYGFLLMALGVLCGVAVAYPLAAAVL